MSWLVAQRTLSTCSAKRSGAQCSGNEGQKSEPGPCIRVGDWELPTLPPWGQLGDRQPVWCVSLCLPASVGQTPSLAIPQMHHLAGILLVLQAEE